MNGNSMAIMLNGIWQELKFRNDVEMRHNQDQWLKKKFAVMRADTDPEQLRLRALEIQDAGLKELQARALSPEPGPTAAEMSAEIAKGDAAVLQSVIDDVDQSSVEARPTTDTGPTQTFSP